MRLYLLATIALLFMIMVAALVKEEEEKAKNAFAKTAAKKVLTKTAAKMAEERNALDVAKMAGLTRQSTTQMLVNTLKNKLQNSISKNSKRIETTEVSTEDNIMIVPDERNEILTIKGGDRDNKVENSKELAEAEPPIVLGASGGPYGEFEPQFDETFPINVSSIVGRSSYLSCRVRNLGNKSLSWIRHRDIHILTVGTYTYSSDLRFQTTYHPKTDEWTLQIKWTQKRDAGVYECQISTQPVRSFYINLQVIVPAAVILGGPDLHVDKGSTINLTCIVRYSPEPPAYIFWYHVESVVSYDSGRGGITVITEKGEISTSYLLIQRADVSDSGRYSCSPSNADVAVIHVYVLQGENPAAMQTESGGTTSRCSAALVAFFVLMYCLSTYTLYQLDLALRGVR